MSDWDIVQLYCEGTRHEPHTRVPVATFYRGPGGRWALSGEPELWPPPAATAGPSIPAGRSVPINGDTPVPISAPRATRTDYDVRCPLPGCHVGDYWRAETVQAPLTATIAARGRHVGYFLGSRDTRLAFDLDGDVGVPLRVFIAAVQETARSNRDTPACRC